MSEQTPEDAWREHNQSFRYEGPDGPPESWSQAEYTELHDRVIGRRVEWYCERCNRPFSRLEAARRHVEFRHGESLYQTYGDTDE